MTGRSVSRAGAALYVDIRVWREGTAGAFGGCLLSEKEAGAGIQGAHFRKASGQKLCKKQNCRADRASRDTGAVSCRFAHVRGRSVWKCRTLVENGVQARGKHCGRAALHYDG